MNVCASDGTGVSQGKRGVAAIQPDLAHVVHSLTGAAAAAAGAWTGQRDCCHGLPGSRDPHDHETGAGMCVLNSMPAASSILAGTFQVAYLSLVLVLVSCAASVFISQPQLWAPAKPTPTGRCHSQLLGMKAIPGCCFYCCFCRRMRCPVTSRTTPLSHLLEWQRTSCMCVLQHVAARPAYVLCSRLE